MSERDFVVGDIVRAKCNGCGYKEGAIYEVYSVKGTYPYNFIDVFDKNKSCLIPGCFARNFELVESAHSGKILIMVDEKDHDKIIARDLLTNKTAEAKRNPEDKWDFNKGAKLALEKLTEPEKPKYWTGKVVCVKNKSSSHFFTVGKVYKVVNGSLLDNDNDPNDPYISRIENFRDLYIRVIGSHEFIEYKGGAEE